MKSYHGIVNSSRLILDDGNYGFSKSMMCNVVSLVGIIDFVEGEEISESDSEEEEEEEDDLVETYKEARETLIKIGQENQVLVKEKVRLDALVESLQNELNDVKKISQESLTLMKEKLVLANKVDKLEKELCAEKEISAKLQSERDQQHKKIHMCVGTKQLDKGMSYDRTKKSNRGLGYTGQRRSNTEQIKFVAEGVSHKRQSDTKSNTVKERGCYFCGKKGHIRAYCYKYWERVNKLKRERKFYWNGYHNQIWVKKSDLYQGASRSTSESMAGRSGSKSGLGFQCVREEYEATSSGYSRHMTETATPVTAAKPTTQSDRKAKSIDDDEFSENYKALYERWLKLVEENSVLTKEKVMIEAQVAEAQKYGTMKEEEASQVRIQLEETQKNLRMLNNGTNQLDHLLSIGKTDRHGLGFNGKPSKSDSYFVSGGEITPAT